MKTLLYNTEYLIIQIFSPKEGYFPRGPERKPMAMTADWWNAKANSLSLLFLSLGLSCSTWILDINNNSRSWHRGLLFIHFIREYRYGHSGAVPCWRTIWGVSGSTYFFFFWIANIKLREMYLYMTHQWFLIYQLKMYSLYVNKKNSNYLCVF